MAAIKKVLETMAFDLGALLDAGDGAVVTLVAGETRLAVHRAVVMDRSPVFQAMFRQDTLEAGSGQVTIPDVEGPVLRQLLAYLYTLRAPQLPSMAAQLLAAADKYGVLDLKAECEQQVAAQLTVENAAATAVLAARHSCPSLTAAAVDFIKAQTHQVMATQGWADAILNQPKDVVRVSRLLIEPSAAIRNLPLEEKNRKLIEAAQVGAVEELQALLASGADVEARTENTETALHWAAWRGHTQAVKCLLDGGAEVDGTTGWQTTALHFAAQGGHSDVVQLLVASSADPNARSNRGKTPMHYAAEYGNTEAVTALQEAGADKGIRDGDGRTPLDFATQHHQKLLEKLT